MPNKTKYSVCKATKREETQTKLLPHHRQRDTLKAFVYEGFNNWMKALSAFDRHEKSEFHRSSLQLIPNQIKETVELSHKRK